MKKLLSGLLIAAMLIGVSGCGTNNDDNKSFVMNKREYVVGVDIPEGTYILSDNKSKIHKTAADKSFVHCYKGDDDILLTSIHYDSNEKIHLRVKEDMRLEVSEGGLIAERINQQEFVDGQIYLYPGLYEIGENVPPGKYTITGASRYDFMFICIKLFDSKHQEIKVDWRLGTIDISDTYDIILPNGAYMEVQYGEAILERE